MIAVSITITIITIRVIVNIITAVAVAVACSSKNTQICPHISHSHPCHHSFPLDLVLDFVLILASEKVILVLFLLKFMFDVLLFLLMFMLVLLLIFLLLILFFLMRDKAVCVSHLAVTRCCRGWKTCITLKPAASSIVLESTPSKLE